MQCRLSPFYEPCMFPWIGYVRSHCGLPFGHGVNDLHDVLDIHGCPSEACARLSIDAHGHPVISVDTKRFSQNLWASWISADISDDPLIFLDFRGHWMGTNRYRWLTLDVFGVHKYR